jgi:hypothetical protein
LHPLTESSGVAGVDPPHLRRYSPSRGSHGMARHGVGPRGRERVDEVPRPGWGSRTRGRRSPTSSSASPAWNVPAPTSAGHSTSTIAFGVGSHTPGRAKRWSWCPGPCVPGARPVGSQAGPRVGPRGPAESGSGMGARPDQGDVIVKSGPSESGRGCRDPA